MMILPEWLTAYQSEVEPDVIIILKAARVGVFYGGRVQIIRSSNLTYDRPHAGEARAREMFERVVDAHVKGEPLP